MANGITTANMSLTRWTNGTDVFDYNQLHENFRLIDEHDHSDGKGVKIPNEGLVNTVGSEAVDTNVIRDGAITGDKIAVGTINSSVLGSNSIQKSNLDFSNINSLITPDDLPDANDVDPGYTVMVTDDVNDPAYVWQFRYCEGESEANKKWFFVGGTSLRNDVFPENYGEKNSSLNTYGDLDVGNTSSITLPSFGKTVVYKVEIWSTVFKGSSDQENFPVSIFNSFKTNNASADDVNSAAALIFDNSDETVASLTPATIYRSTKFTASSTTTSLTAQFRQTGLIGENLPLEPFFVTRHGIAVTPIYITV